MRSLSSHESVHSYELMVKKTGGTFDNIKDNNASYSILALEQQWACSYDDCATHAMAYKLGKFVKIKAMAVKTYKKLVAYKECGCCGGIGEYYLK